MLWGNLVYHLCRTSEIFYKGIDVEGERHVICVYADDYTDLEEVNGLRVALKAIGVKRQIGFKPDAYTHLGIYKENPWNIRPSRYLEWTLGMSIRWVNYWKTPSLDNNSSARIYIKSLPSCYQFFFFYPWQCLGTWIFRLNSIGPHWQSSFIDALIATAISFNLISIMPICVPMTAWYLLSRRMFKGFGVPVQLGLSGVGKYSFPTECMTHFEFHKQVRRLQNGGSF